MIEPFRVGETKMIRQTVSADAAFAISAVTIDIYDGSGVKTVSAGAGTGTPTLGQSDTSHVIGYLWTPATAGDYSYILFRTIGSEIRASRGEITVLPAWSETDKWVSRILDLMVEGGTGEAQQLLTYRNLREAAKAAVRMYSRDYPRKVLKQLSLTASVWEYSLAVLAEWVDDFSHIESWEYPYDTTEQVRYYLDPRYWYVDAQRRRFGFRSGYLPSSGEVAQVVYTAPHSLTDEQDTVPESDREAVCQYAAGIALMQAANRAAQTSANQQGADLVSYRTKQQEYSAQARALMDMGAKGWRKRHWVL